PMAPDGFTVRDERARQVDVGARKRAPRESSLLGRDGEQRPELLKHDW
ncbi:MAG: hypothetical protein RL591_2582, partial [Planctomycetota bacterium]